MVSRLSPEEIIEIFTILSSLESLAVKLAVKKLEQPQRDELNQIVVEIDTALAKPTFEQSDWKYHFEANEIIFRAAKVLD